MCIIYKFWHLNFIQKKFRKRHVVHTHLKKNFMTPSFYGWCLTASRLRPFRGGSLLLPLSAQKFLVLTFIDLGRMKD